MTGVTKTTDTRVPSPAGFNTLVAAHGLYALSGAAYSVYWTLQEQTLDAAAVSVFAVSVILGFAGAAGELVASGVSRPRTLPYSRVGPVPIIGASMAVLIVAWFVTSVVMGRLFTSELIFVTVWAALELYSLDDAHRRGWITGSRAGAAVALVAFALAFGLACYAVYYLLEGRARFYAGLVPYIAFSLAMLLVAVLLLMERQKLRGAPKSP